jgi:hypothetical protein
VTRPGSAIRLALVAALLVAGCAAPAPSATASPSPVVTPSPSPTPAPSPTPSPRAPAGTAYVDVPEAGIRIPVSLGWALLDAAALADPALRATLPATYPGSGALVAAMDQLDGRAEPVFLAADPSPPALAGPLATNLSVLVSQPSVGGFLLDFVAGFIADGLSEALGATGEPVRDRVALPAGEAVRLRYSMPAVGGEEMAAVAWVIGAPAGTLLVTVMGTASAVDDLDPNAIAGAIVLLAGDEP